MLNFFAYTREKLPEAANVAAMSLGEPANQSRLDELAQNCWLGELTSFMLFAEKELPPIVNRTLSTIFTDEEKSAALIKRTQCVPVHHLKSSLKFTGANFPEFHGKLASALGLAA